MISLKLLVVNLIETFAMLYFGIHLFKLSVERRRIITTGILYALTIYTIRNIYEIFQIPLGTHSIIGLALFSIYCILICKLSIVEAIATAYVSFTLIIIGEWVITVPVLEKLGISGEQLFNSWINIGVCLTAEIFLIIGIIICYIRRRKGKEAKITYIGIEE